MMQKNLLRQDALEIMNAGLSAIRPEKILNEKVVEKLGLQKFKKIYVFGAGKGVRFLAKILEELLDEKITGGLVTDIETLELKKIKVQVASHPLPDKNSLASTQRIIREIRSISPVIGSSDTLILCLFTGGGSALFCWPNTSVKHYGEINEQLIKSGADITEINVVRKHLDRVKGGGLAKIIAPWPCLTLLVSDVPGNDIGVIASGPTVYDKSTISDAEKIIKKYNLPKFKFLETEKDEKYFNNVDNELIATNKLALEVMKDMAKQLRYKSRILTDSLVGDATNVGQMFLEKVKPGEALIAGGETTMKVDRKGRGGRNTHLCLAALPYLKPNTCLLSINSDGNDNSDVAGAVIDEGTIKKAQKLGLASDNYFKRLKNPRKKVLPNVNEVNSYLENFDSYNFFRQTGDLIKTGKLPTNISDLIIVLQRP